MNPGGALTMVCRLGDRLRRTQDWATTKSLILVATEAGGWHAGAAMADALGVPTDTQERIYRELYGEHPHTYTIVVTTRGPVSAVTPPLEESA